MTAESLLLDFRARVAHLRGRGIYSHYADKHQCIFIHIPKAAGTSVALTLFGQGSRHLPWTEYHRANPGKFRRYFKFAFVRNPWDRLVSTYFFLQSGGLNEQDQAWSNRVLPAYQDFDSFVKGWLTPKNIKSWVHFRPQHEFICDQNGRNMMDFTGRLENMQEDFKVVAKRVGCTRELAKVNTGERGHYRDYYSNETRNIVANIYARDIALLDYAYDPN
jgi:chondroitin 4-sulfotransferase 11